jgi:SAM-dependent methyltransferase
MPAAPSDWYRNFFHGVALDVWRAFATPEYTRAEADSLARLLRVLPPARLLDVPCGNGRLSLELASRGYEVTGVDIAGEAIAEGQSETARRKLPVTLHQGDMRELKALGVPEGAFAGAYCWGNSFGYLEDEGNVEFVHAVARALKAGAVLVLESGMLAESCLPGFVERRWFPIGDMMLVVQNSYDHERGRMDTDYHFVTQQGWEMRRGSQRVYTYRELSGILAGAGFGNFQITSSLAGEPFRLGSQRAIITAVKVV